MLQMSGDTSPVCWNCWSGVTACWSPGRSRQRIGRRRHWRACGEGRRLRYHVIKTDVVPVLVPIGVCRPGGVAGADGGPPPAVRAGGGVPAAAACLGPDGDGAGDGVVARGLEVR